MFFVTYRLSNLRPSQVFAFPKTLGSRQHGHRRHRLRTTLIGLHRWPWLPGLSVVIFTYGEVTVITQSLSRDGILNELKNLKPELSRRYGVSRLGLFGSFAKNTARETSDIDVVVELDDPDLFSLVHIKELLEEDFQRSVDLIPYSPLMNAFLKGRIQSEAIYV